MPKNILIVNDIPGAGKVAGNINLPILSAAGLETSILPTLILSKNTDYDQGEVVRHSLSQDFQAILNHWASSDINFDLYTTGYFENEKQIQSFQDFYLAKCQTHGPARLYVDPIMGDHGKLYPGFNQDIPKVIGQLCQGAYLVVPNVTEACLMTGYPYSKQMSGDQLKELAQGILQLGAEHVILSGVENEETAENNQIGFFLLQNDGCHEFFLHKKYDQLFFGTGDMAMSLIIAYHENGLSLAESLVETGHFIEGSLEDTLKLNRPIQDGVYFERRLFDLAGGIREHNLPQKGHTYD